MALPSKNIGTEFRMILESVVHVGSKNGGYFKNENLYLEPMLLI